MQPIVYDVAVSLDGYIAGRDGAVDAFAHEGPVVDDYQQRLASYSCAIMGRATYEFGYRYGLAPGDNPYPHLKSYVISHSIALPGECDVTVVRSEPAVLLRDLRQRASGPIYLCGGGALAGWMRSHDLIDVVRLKRAPVLLGEGTRLFGDDTGTTALSCVSTTVYGGGYLFQEFRRCEATENGGRITRETRGSRDDQR
jgi:dihydrofolate reductase